MQELLSRYFRLCALEFLHYLASVPEAFEYTYLRWAYIFDLGLVPVVLLQVFGSLPD